MSQVKSDQIVDFYRVQNAGLRGEGPEGSEHCGHDAKQSELVHCLFLKKWFENIVQGSFKIEGTRLDQFFCGGGKDTINRGVGS